MSDDRVPVQIRWRTLSELPNIVFIRSRHGHTTVDDGLAALWSTSPLWVERVARIDVHSLSGERPLAVGLREASELCLREEPWVVVLVRGGGPSKALDKMAAVLGSETIRPLIETLAPRLIFSMGHAVDQSRYQWVHDLCLASGSVPMAALSNFCDRLAAEGVFRRAHESLDIVDGLPLVSEMPQVRDRLESRWLRERVLRRWENRLQNACITSDFEFFEIVHRGGKVMGFVHVAGIDYRPMVVSQDQELWLTDSFYSLPDWRDMFVRARLEEWEIEYAFENLYGCQRENPPTG